MPKSETERFESNRAKARALRKEISDTQGDIPIGGKGYDRDVGPIDAVTKRKERATAFDAGQNRREQDAEMYEERDKRGEK